VPEPIEVHVTELDWFYECAYRYSRQKVVGDWPETNSRPFMRGRAVHKAREHALLHFSGQIEGQEDKKGSWPTYEELVQIGRERLALDLGGDMAPFDTELNDYFWEEPDTGKKVPMEEIVDEVDPYVRFDVEHILPRFEGAEMVAVEERWHILIEDDDLQDTYELTGKLDLLVREPVSGRLVNHDLKTGSKITQEAADLTPQLSGYSAGIHAQYGEYPLHALGSPRFLKRCPKEVKPGSVVEQIHDDLWGVYETISTDRGPEHVAAFLSRLKMVLQMREQGWFPPAKGGFMSPCQRCPHAFAEGSQACPYTKAGR
jgi:hypothetical protein